MSEILRAIVDPWGLTVLYFSAGGLTYLIFNFVNGQIMDLTTSHLRSSLVVLLWPFLLLSMFILMI